MGWRWKLIWIWINERIHFRLQTPYSRCCWHPLSRPLLLTSIVAIIFNVSSALIQLPLLPPILLLVTHQQFLTDDSPSPSPPPPPPPPPRTEQVPANQHMFIITLYYSYRPFVAFLPFVVTSLNVVRFPKAHAQLFVVSCIIIFFPPFSFLHLSFARYPTHHTPYTIYTSLPPPHTLYSHTSRSIVVVSPSFIVSHLLSAFHPSIHPSPHCHILQTYLCITIFIHSHSPFTSFLPSTLLPPPSGLGCCFPFLLPFFHRYSSNMSTCPLTSSKVLTQSRTPDFLRSLMISPYTIPTGFFYTLRALPFFHSIRSVLSFTFDVTSFS